MVEKKRSVMKYIRTYDDYESYKAEYSDTSRGFRLKPTLYKYSEAGDHIVLETDDPRKHEGSTYMEITLDSDVEFSFYIGNKSGDTQTTMTCSIDWGDDTIETKTITKDTYGFKLAHNYVAGSYKIELYDVERDYSVVEGVKVTITEGGYYYYHTSRISHPSSVKRIVLGERVVKIGAGAFGYCTSLTSIYIPEGVTIINEETFGHCTSLKSIYIPKSVTSIESWVFLNCRALRSIHIPESVTIIEAAAFQSCSSLTSIRIPKGVTSIDTNAFRECTSLKSIYLPKGITTIKPYAFYKCSSLTSINIPNSVTLIDKGAFESCTSLTSIYLPKGITTINRSSFYSCSSLKSIDIPEKVTSIGDSAFEGCSSLTSISSFNLTTPTLGGNIFLNLPTNGTLHIKPGATGYDAWLSKLPEGWRIVEDL